MTSNGPASSGWRRRLTDWVRLRLSSRHYQRTYLAYWKLKRHIWPVTVAVVLAIAVFVLFGFRLRLGSYYARLDSGLLPQLCIGVGAALIGLIAVVFTLSLFVIQQISDRSVPGILREYAADRAMRVIYTALSILAVLSLTGALLPHKSHPVLLFTLPLFCAVFSLILLGILFERVAYLSDPSNIILHIWNSSMGQLKRLRTMQAELLSVNPTLTNETDAMGNTVDHVGMATAALYAKFPFITKRLNKSLNDLHGLMRHFSSEDQYALLGEASDAVVNIVGKYIELRGSSLMMANSATAMLGLESGWDASLIACMEMFDGLLRTAVETGNTTRAKTLLRSLATLARNGIACKPFAAPHGEHPTVDFIEAYLVGVAKHAVAKRNDDIILCFNNEVLPLVASLASQGYWLSARTMVESWSQIATAAIISRQPIAATDTTGAILKLLNFTVEHDELGYSGFVKHLRDTVMKLCQTEVALGAAGQPLGASLSASPDTPLRLALSGVSPNSFLSIHSKIVNLIAASGSDEKYDSWARGVHMLDEFDDGLWMSLIKVGELSASGTQSVLFNLNQCAYGIAEQLLWLWKQNAEMDFPEPKFDSISDGKERVQAASQFNRRTGFEADLEKLLHWHVIAFYSRCRKLKPSSGKVSEVHGCLESAIGIAVQALGLGIPKLAVEIAETVGRSFSALLKEGGVTGVVDNSRAMSELTRLGLVATHENSGEVLAAVQKVLLGFHAEAKAVINGQQKAFQNWSSPELLLTEWLADVVDGSDRSFLSAVRLSVWRPTFSRDEAERYLHTLLEALAS